MDSPSRRINLQIKTSERKGQVDVQATDGNVESPALIKAELQEALENVSGLESRLEQDPFLDTEVSSQQTGVQSRLISDEGKLTGRRATFKNRSRFLQKEKQTGT